MALKGLYISSSDIIFELDLYYVISVKSQRKVRHPSINVSRKARLQDLETWYFDIANH